MGERFRWALILVLPLFAGVFLLVRTVWRAYVATLSESALHLQVFDHAAAVAITLWALILALTLGLTWWVAGRLVARSGATSGDRTG